MARADRTGQGQAAMRALKRCHVSTHPDEGAADAGGPVYGGLPKAMD